MARDPRLLDQNPVVIDPADVEAVLKDEPTPISDPRHPPLEEVSNDNAPGDGKAKERTAGRYERDSVQTVDGSRHGTPLKPEDPRR
ncbi:hypothetical protein FHS55_002533 [Angulomicrobium tetraedrale]|uniref:Uncharacterized protein n=1 Tax=Ancylobacter tetraedralis TaxID=217068 RepID=A0A839ZB10_9HYPH|nr:hypothetical protein [Ancylobacter tetraedralis]MBB3771924.1 hypothetical protein [Ancylobacter tetraedralis]